MLVSARSKKASMMGPRRSWKRWSRLNALCQALVRSTCQRWLAWMGAFSPLWAIWPWRPRPASSSRVLPESYPESRCAVMSSGNGPMSASLSRVGANSGESCRLAPASTRPKGDAEALHHQRAFHALLAPIDRGRAGALAATGGFGDAPAHGNLVQYQADDAVVGVQGDLLELGEQPGLDPFVAAVADCGS